MPEQFVFGEYVKQDTVGIESVFAVAAGSQKFFRYRAGRNFHNGRIVEMPVVAMLAARRADNSGLCDSYIKYGTPDRHKE